MPEKSLLAAAAVDEALVQLLGFAAHRRVGADAARGIGGELQVLEHQRGREPAFVIVVGGRVGPDARHRRIARHRPALARRLGRDVEEGLRGRARASAPARTPRRSRPWSRRGSCCCRSSPPGRRRAAPAWITALAIGSRNGRARSNCSSVPPTMKVRVPAAAAAMPPETGASTKSKPLRLHLLADLARAGDVDGRAVDQQRAGLGVGRDVVLDRPRGHACAAGSMVMTTSASLTASAADAGRRAAAFDRVLHRFGEQVEGADLMPRLGEVRRHPAAHVAEADECDLAP